MLSHLHKSVCSNKIHRIYPKKKRRKMFKDDVNN